MSGSPLESCLTDEGPCGQSVLLPTLFHSLLHDLFKIAPRYVSCGSTSLYHIRQKHLGYVDA